MRAAEPQIEWCPLADLNRQGLATSERLRSGPLSKGHDKDVNGNSFYTAEGKGVASEDLCKTKKNEVSGCDLETRVVDRTKKRPGA